jgi:hypothetical protein
MQALEGRRAAFSGAIQIEDRVMHSRDWLAGNRGRVAGKGGSMEIKKQGTNGQEEQTSSTAKKKARRPRGKAAQTDDDGVERFRSAAEKELAQRGRQIAMALAAKAAGGDVSSAKLLMTEAGKAGSKKTKKRNGKPTAQDLARGALWDGPPAKTGEEFEEWNGDPDAGAGSARAR